jgi:hypothetical protein
MKKQGKRFFYLLLSLALLATSMLGFAGMAAAANMQKQIQVSVDGNLVQFAVAPMVIDDRIVVQMRPIFEALDATVQWDGADKTITATKGSTTIVLQIGSYTATVNGKTVTLVTPPLIINQHTMVPVRFVSDFLGYKVAWDAADRQVNITSPVAAPIIPPVAITTP